MKEIKSYLSIIEPNLLNRLNGKVAAFIKIVKEGNFASEEALIKQVCKGGKDKSYYNNLKSKSLRVLQSLAIVSTNSESNTLVKKLEHCQKDFVLGKKFLNTGIRSEGIRLIKKSYKIAVAYEFTHMACELASILHKDAAHYQTNLKLANKYADEVEQYAQNYLTEKKIERYYLQLVAKVNKGKTITVSEVYHILEKVNALAGKSILCQVLTALIQVHAGVYSKKYEEVIEKSDQALQLFEKRQGVNISQIKFFHDKKGVALMTLERFAAAKESFERGLSFASRFTPNYFVSKLHICINALHAGDYDTAFEHYRANRNCKFYFIQKQFSIIEAYLYFLSKKGHLSSSRFRIGKFLLETENEIDNLNVLIARLLVVLVQGQNDFITEVQRLEKELPQYLKLPGSKRANQFLKILITLAKTDFDLTRVEHRVASQVAFLETTPLALGDSLAFEMIPFHHLWEMIALKLKRKTA